MNPFNEQFLINKNNNLSFSERGVSADKKNTEDISVTNIIPSLEDIKKDDALTTKDKIFKTQELLQQLKEQETLWQGLSEEEKELYKTLSPEEKKEYLKLNPEEKKEYLKLNPKEKKEYLKLNPEEKDFYLNHPQLRDRLLEKKIELFNMTIGERSKEQIQQELNERGKIEDYNNPKHITNEAQWMSDCEDFKTNPEKKELKLIKLSVASLGLPEGSTYQEIMAKGNEMGLTLCPAEVAPLLRLDYERLLGHDQPKNEYIAVAMDAISDSDGRLYMFRVSRYNYGRRCLDFCPVGLSRFNPGSDFLFARK